MTRGSEELDVDSKFSRRTPWDILSAQFLLRYRRRLDVCSESRGWTALEFFAHLAGPAVGERRERLRASLEHFALDV